MSKIYQFVPVSASAKFEIEKPHNWNGMSLKEKKEYFLKNCQHTGSLCWHCANDLETDAEILHDEYEKDHWWNEGDFWEED